MSGSIIEKNAKIKFKILLGCLLSFVLVLSLIQSGFAMANPAAVYCKEMNKEFGGYDYKIKNDVGGNSYGVCVVDGKEFGDWDFYNGKIGKEYSYCEKKGLESEIIDGKVNCKTKENKNLDNKDFKEPKAMSFDSQTPSFSVNEQLGIEEKSATTLISLRNGAIAKQIISGEGELLKLKQSLSAAPLIYYNYTNYSYWDWRSPNRTTIWSNLTHNFFDNSNGWLTPIKDQSTCGSCWAFSINGAVESKYEFNNNNSRLNPDLSEQSSVSCDHSCYAGHSYPDLSNCNSGCDGGWLDLNLNYLSNNGTVDDNCFPYINADGDCSSRCSNYASRTWTINGADYSGWWYGFSQEELKQWILDYGPSPIAIHMEQSIDGNGFINCGAGGSSNHAVVLAGYNDTGNDATSYWILKNSWGTGSGKSGYFYIRFNDNCNVGDEVYYINNTVAPEFKLNVTMNSPNIDFSSNNRTQIINFTIGSKLYANSTCDLIINNAINQTNSTVRNATVVSFRIDSLSDGNYNMSVRCWENTLGIINESVVRNMFISGNTISTSLLLPSTGLFSKTSSQNFSCRSISGSSYSLTNTTFFLWNSTSQVYNQTVYYINGTLNETNFNYSFSIEENYKWNCLSRNNNSNVSFASLNNSFVYDITTPNITLASPGDSYAETASSSTLTFSYNVTDVNNISNCSLIVNGAVNTINTTVNSSSITATFSAGSYSWNINCSDIVGNIGNSSSRSFTITAPAAVCTNCGGGGGGGGGSSTHTYVPSENQIIEGYNSELGKDDKIKISDGGSGNYFKENHTIVVSSVTSSYASLIISSNPINVTLLIGEERKLSLDNPGYYDLLIRLNSISNNKVNFTVKAIYEKIPIRSGLGLGLDNQSEEVLDEEIVESSTGGLSRNAKVYIYEFIIVGIAILVAIFVKAMKRIYPVNVKEEKITKNKRKLKNSNVPSGSRRRVF